MSRTWPGNSTVDYLNIPASTAFDFNTNICLMAILRVPTLRNTPANESIMVVGNQAGARGYQFAFGDDDGQLAMSQVAGSIVNGGLGTAIIVNTWLAVGCFGGTGVGKSFKRYDYTSLATGTGGATTMAAPIADSGRIGQNLVLGAPPCFIGDIDRVLIGQGTVSDAEFTAWARAGTLPPSMTVAGYWILSPSGTATDPEVDLGPNSLHIAGANIVGTTASAAFVLPDAPSGPSINVGDPVGVGDQRFVPA